MSLGRLLSVGGAGAIGAAGTVTGFAAAGLVANAFRYIVAGGLELFVGWLLLLAATVAGVAAVATLVGFTIAVRRAGRFPTVSAVSGMALLGWSGTATGSSMGGTEIVWLVALGSGIGLALIVGGWLVGAAAEWPP